MFGARGGSRTHTPLRALAPEASESTNSTTRAFGSGALLFSARCILPQGVRNVNCFFKKKRKIFHLVKTGKKSVPTAVCAVRITEVQTLAGVRSRRHEKMKFLFDGGMYVGENTTRSANVRAQRVRCGRPQTTRNSGAAAVAKQKSPQRFALWGLCTCSGEISRRSRPAWSCPNRHRPADRVPALWQWSARRRAHRTRCSRAAGDRGGTGAAGTSRCRVPRPD